MIHSVKMTNFKQHRNRVIEFGPGVNSIQGENGSGKTNILRAILFAYFGAAAAGAKDHLVTRGESKTEVEIDTTIGTVGRVQIIRSLTKAEVRQEGKILASGQTPVTAYIEEQLGMDSKLFRSMLYAQQGKTQHLLDIGPTGLQKHLETVANVEVVDKVLTMISRDTTSAEGELRGIGELEDINGLRDRLAVSEKDKAAAEERAAAAKLQVDDLAEQARAIRADLVVKQGQLKQATESEQLINNTQAMVTNTQQRRVELLSTEVAEVDTSTLEQLTGGVRQLTAEITQDRQDLHSHSVAVQRYFSSVNHLKELKQAEPLISQAKAAEALVSAADKLHSEAQRHELSAKQTLANATCPTCKRAYEQADLAKLQQGADAAVVASAAASKNFQDRKAELDKILTAAGKTFQQLTKLEASIAATEELMETLKEPDPVSITVDSIRAKEAKLAEMQQEVINVNKAATLRQAWVSSYEQVTQQLTALQTKLTDLQTAAAQMPKVSQELVQSLHGRLDDLMIKINTANSELQSANQAVAVESGVVKGLGIQIHKVEELMDRANTLRRENALRTSLEKYLRKNRSKFMEDSWTGLINYTSELISSVTEGYFTDLSRDESGEFAICEDGQTVPVSELSGAQRSISGLCLRIGLAHLFYGDNGVILLDESTADCSEANSARVAGMLRGLRAQVIMVTHRQADAVNANHAIVLN